MLDDLLERAEFRRVGLGAREVLLVRWEGVASVVRDETLSIDKTRVDPLVSPALEGR